MQHATSILTLVLGLLVAGRVQAGIIIFGGDAIGPNSSWTDGWGLNPAVSGHSDWGWNSHVGQPAFNYTSDGKGTFSSLRTVVSSLQHSTGVDWSKYNWTIDIWSKDTYLTKGDPIQTIHLGNTPSNWSGFQTLSPTHVIPNTQPFGAPGGNAPNGAVSYELVFDLSGQTALQNALPAGEYIIGLRSGHNVASFGETSMLSSRVGQGPTPFYSSGMFNIDPTPVIGVLTSNQDFRWAMNLGIQNDFANGDFGLGLQGWSSTGPGGVEIIEVNGNKLAQFTAGSPVTLSQWMITESNPMSLSFDLFALQGTGTMDLMWGNTVLSSYDASLFNNQWTTFSYNFTDPSHFNSHDQLSFRWDGYSGDVVQLDNIQYNSVPEPTSLTLLLTAGVMGAYKFVRRRKD